ncbi:MAG: flavodoxin family protein [Actinobacteria bacterium]|nr:flavodoxin family protein [Actinomycetota bacterium]MDI6831852.1 flavodoxin family protein [Actinomycetota bacterium]
MEGEYLLALYTSPRRNGNTSLLLDALSEGAGEAGLEVRAFRVADMDLRPCRACNACFRDGECVQKDDMQEIYPHLLGAEAVAMAAPIFSMNICAQAKALIDRCQRFWSARYVLGRELVEPERAALRRGFFLSCCGRDKPQTFDCTRPVMAYFFYMIRVGDWTSLTFAGVDEAGRIREVEGALEGARELGRSLRPRS